jgi:hypothetical protein
MSETTQQAPWLPTTTLAGTEVLPVKSEAGAGPAVRTTTDAIAALALTNAITATAGQSGDDLTLGELVTNKGWDSTADRPSVQWADNSAVSLVAQWIVTDTAADTDPVSVQKTYTLTGQNTSAGSVGDPVYLSTSGGWTLTKPTAIGSFAQRVGVVTVDHASTGEIYFDLNNAPVIETGTNQMIAGLADALWTVAIAVAAQVGQKRVATVTVKDFQSNTLAAATQLVFKPTTAVSTFSVTDEGAGTGLTTSASNVCGILTAASGIAEIGFTNDAGTIAIAFETPRGPVVQSIAFT